MKNMTYDITLRGAHTRSAKGSGHVGVRLQFAHRSHVHNRSCEIQQTFAVHLFLPSLSHFSTGASHRKLPRPVIRDRHVAATSASRRSSHPDDCSAEGMPNLPTNIMDFRGFDSSIILMLRGGILMSKGDFLESLSQAIFAGIMLVGRLGAKGNRRPRGARPGPRL